MEAFAVMTSPQTQINNNILINMNVGVLPKNLNSRVCFSKGNFGKKILVQGGSKNNGALAVGPLNKISASAPLSSDSSSETQTVDGAKLFVGLPLDVVTNSNKINHEKAITAGLKALKLMGVDGVELPIWWGVVEKDGLGKYDWSGYLAIAELVQKIGLELHVSLCFHASQLPNIRLPNWVSRVGDSDPGIYFTDRSGRQSKNCLSFSVDELPVLHGKSPMNVYEDFCNDFKSTFAAFMESTIVGINISLGPDGELKYPSQGHSTETSNNLWVGEFQCYDKYSLNHLKQHAADTGNPEWGSGGPHDAPSYNEPPSETAFFKDKGGSWETAYGDFFLSWYSSQLISHGDRILSLASSVFSDTRVSISGKLPLVHSWHKTRSHPAELTAGFYNTANRDGYESVVEMFAKNSCTMVLPGMDLLDEHQPNGSSPQLLLSQIKGHCQKHGLHVSGQNMSISKSNDGFGEIKRNLLEDNRMVDHFTYHRMGADFFSPKHFPRFTAFVRSLSQLDLDVDVMPEGEEDVEPVHANSEAGLNLIM